MLPDFPEFKAECERVLLERTKRRKAEELRFLPSTNEVALWEGDKLLVIREDGSKSESKFVHVESHYEISNAEAEQLTMEQLVSKFEKVGEDLGGQQARHVFKVVDQTIEEAGNVVHSKPDEPLAVVFFRVLECCDVAFDAKGVPTFQIVCAPAMEAKFKALEAEFAINPELRRRHDLILQTKREEWRDRESDRKLVD